MAIITTTTRLNSLVQSTESWVGQLFAADDTTSVPTRTTTQYNITHGSGSPYAGCKVLVTGTGFSYLDGVPTDGTITSIKIVDGTGQTLVTFSGFAAGSFASDLAQFRASMFGSDTYQEPSGKAAWSHLMSGNDTINGTAGNDDWVTVTGLNAGNDTFNMGAGNDFMEGGVGNDTFNGGAGRDQLSYEQTTWDDSYTAIRGVTVNVATQTVLDPWGGTDRVSSVEEFTGSRFKDSFFGGGGSDTFAGLRGQDLFDGGANSFDSSGARTGDDADTLLYRYDFFNGGARGIVVDLETSFSSGSVRGTIRDSFGQIDRVIDIERVGGTRYADLFVGSRMDNHFSGGAGKDTYNGEGGSDRVLFAQGQGPNPPGSGISVDLRKASGQVLNDGFGNVETLTSIEQIAGTDRADLIILDAKNNEVQGLDGKDTLTGGGGEDSFHFVNQREANDGDRITDFIRGQDVVSFDNDFWDGMTLTKRIVNGAAATGTSATFVFDAANDTLYWDPDGTGAKAKLAVVTLTGINSLSVNDLEIY